jgi:glucose-6-phosphate dehydrogenase assembly protein OpcA
VRSLVISDLPVFLRWRGDLPFGAAEFEGLVDVADRLVVNGAEWSDARAAYSWLVPYFDRVIVSDIAWTRLAPWRAALAARWPGIAGAAQLRVRGPSTDALLLGSWLNARLRRKFELVHEEAETMEELSVDGDPVAFPRYEELSTADLLSDQLEIDARDRIYEEAVAELAGVS